MNNRDRAERTELLKRLKTEREALLRLTDLFDKMRGVTFVSDPKEREMFSAEVVREIVRRAALALVSSTPPEDE